MSSTGHGGFFGWLSGIAAAVISGVLVVVLTSDPAESDPEPTPVPPCCGQSIDFAITDQLGPGQISERISVSVNGRSVGTLTVDTVHTNATITVTLPSTGRYDYRLEGSMLIADGYGGSIPVTGYGTGVIEASHGRSFAVLGDFSTNPIRLSLE
jgi:hypothetical protein